MAFEDWDKNAEGNITVYPVAGWDSFVPFGMMCGLRVHYVTHPAMLDSEERLYLPLIMTVPQARELVEVLTRLADKVEQRAPNEREH